MSDDPDDLDDLKAAFRAATPRPDPAVKAAHMRAGQESFARFQEMAGEARPRSTTPDTGFWTGVKTMLASLTSRGGLTITTALVAFAIVAVTPAGRDIFRLPAPGEMTRDPAPAVLQMPATDEAVSADPVTATVAEDSDAPGDLAVRPAAKVRAAPSAAMRGREAGGTLGLSEPMMEVESPRIPEPARVLPPKGSTEAFAEADPNPLKVTAEEPVSTFSIDVDTASYSVVRNSILNGQLPPSGAVRIEEMINYFPYAYPGPEAGAAFRPTVSVFETPWNAGTRIVQIGLQGALPAIAERPPLNLVFLIDTSGSMQDTNKLPLLKQSLRLMLTELRPEDQVAIVTYAGSAGQVLAPTAARDRATILAALDRLEAGGSTAGQAGLEQAYATAEEMADAGEVTRVILATDGDFNVGLSDPGALETFIAGKRDTGSYLSILGFGRGNLDDATMQALAQTGNGQAAYIDTLNEARKVLVDQLTGALFPIADDVKVQVEFNPAHVAEYRLIGYETRALNRADFNNDRVDAGEIGAGHSVTALYEVTPVGSPARLTDPLRYGAGSDPAEPEGELGLLRLRWKAPGASESRLIETPITGAEPATEDARFATAIAGFGQLLRRESALADWSYDDAIALATETRGEDAFGYRAEAISLMRLAESLTR